MQEPEFFLLFLIAGILACGFSVCVVTGGVWLFFGWWKKTRSVQLLSALPFGVGIFIIAPLLILVLVFIAWSFIAWASSPRSTQRSPNTAVERMAAGGHLSPPPMCWAATTVHFFRSPVSMKRLLAFLILGLVFATTASAEVITNGVSIGVVQKAMANAHYTETGLDMAAIRSNEALRFWGVGEGVLIFRFSKSSGRVLEMTYFLCDERAKAVRKTFSLTVVGFDAETGTMTVRTSPGERGEALNDRR